MKTSSMVVGGLVLAGAGLIGYFIWKRKQDVGYEDYPEAPERSYTAPAYTSPASPMQTAIPAKQTGPKIFTPPPMPPYCGAGRVYASGCTCELQDEETNTSISTPRQCPSGYVLNKSQCMCIGIPKVVG